MVEPFLFSLYLGAVLFGLEGGRDHSLLTFSTTLVSATSFSVCCAFSNLKFISFPSKVKMKDWMWNVTLPFPSTEECSQVC